MINLIIGTAFGILVGSTVCHFALANDPCEKPFDRNYDQFKENKPSEDAAMQFHWSNGQPSLHPK